MFFFYSRLNLLDSIFSYLFVCLIVLMLTATKKVTVGNMHLHCNLWYCIVGTTNMATISNVTNGNFHGSKQIRMEYELSQFDRMST